MCVGSLIRVRTGQFAFSHIPKMKIDALFLLSTSVVWAYTCQDGNVVASSSDCVKCADGTEANATRSNCPL